MLVAAPIIGVLRHWQILAEFRLKLVRSHDFGVGEQRARGPVSLFGLRLLGRYDNLRHADRVDLITGLHYLLLQIKEDLGKARLLFRQSKHGLVHHLQSKRSMDALAM